MKFERIWFTIFTNFVAIVRQFPWMWSQASKRQTGMGEG